MKIKSIIAALLLCCSLQPLKAQTNHVYGEFLGVGLLGGFSYERMVMDKLAARVSYGGFTATSSSMVTDADYGFSQDFVISHRKNSGFLNVFEHIW